MQCLPGSVYLKAIYPSSGWIGHASESVHHLRIISLSGVLFGSISDHKQLLSKFPFYSLFFSFQFVLSTIVYLSLELSKVVCQSFKSEHIKSSNRHMQSFSYLLLILNCADVSRYQSRVQEIASQKVILYCDMWDCGVCTHSYNNVWHSYASGQRT